VGRILARPEQLSEDADDALGGGRRADSTGAACGEDRYTDSGGGAGE